jgi:hypothetical protein
VTNQKSQILSARIPLHAAKNFWVVSVTFWGVLALAGYKWSSETQATKSLKSDGEIMVKEGM